MNDRPAESEAETLRARLETTGSMVKGCEVTLKMEMLGWAGTALVIVAYVPQIHHLYVEKCAWGISISTWLIWLVAAALLLSYSVFRNDTLFTFVQIINLTAIMATIMLARRSNNICPYHLQSTLTARDESLQRRGLAKDEAVGET